MSKKARTSWIDDTTQTPHIDKYARQLEGFVNTFADDRVDDAELKAQEERLTNLMREIEPQLDDSLHERVTQLLCELTAFDIMQCFKAMQDARPKTKFHG